MAVAKKLEKPVTFLRFYATFVRFSATFATRDTAKTCRFRLLFSISTAKFDIVRQECIIVIELSVKGIPLLCGDSVLVIRPWDRHPV